MIVSQLSLNNFRKFKCSDDDHGVTVTFHKGLNALIGENDSGKSAIIDAIKLVLLTQSNEYIRPVEEVWLGYPLWYHPARYLSELLEDFRIVGANYITWWSLDYAGETAFERLFQAYNYTFLNLTQETRDKKLKALIEKSGASCAVTLHNKSCKCDLVSARNVGIPQAELEIDLIDRTFLDISRARGQIALLAAGNVEK